MRVRNVSRHPRVTVWSVYFENLCFSPACYVLKVGRNMTWLKSHVPEIRPPLAWKTLKMLWAFLRTRFAIFSFQELKEQNELLYDTKVVLEEQLAGLNTKEERIGEISLWEKFPAVFLNDSCLWFIWTTTKQIALWSGWGSTPGWTGTSMERRLMWVNQITSPTAASITCSFQSYRDFTSYITLLSLGTTHTQRQKGMLRKR